MHEIARGRITLCWAWLGCLFLQRASAHTIFLNGQNVTQGPNTTQNMVWLSQREKHLPSGKGYIQHANILLRSDHSSHHYSYEIFTSRRFCVPTERSGLWGKNTTQSRECEWRAVVWFYTRTHTYMFLHTCICSQQIQ